MKTYRQGDVLIIEVVKAEKGEPIQRDKGKIVLAYGEVTGHSHAITVQDVFLYHHAKNLQEKILEVKVEKALLQHEEHSHIELPKGEYIVRIQREYSLTGIRNVQD
jgi:hypothetical protein